MTILQASIDLFNWFKDHDSFSLSNKSDLEGLGAKTNEDFAALSIALDRLEKIEIVKGVEPKSDKNSKIYILEKNMQNFNQSVTLNGGVAYKVASCINYFCERIKDDSDLCDPVSICEKDILNLTLIADHFSKKTLESSSFPDDASESYEKN